jgi:hypothetical protein
LATSTSGDAAAARSTDGATILWDESARADPAPARAQQAPVAIPAGQVLLQDDFSNPSSGWDVGDHSGGRSGYVDGEYFVIAMPDGSGVRFGFRSEVARDFVAEVDARLTGGRQGEAVYLGVRLARAQPGVPGGYVRLIVGPVTGRVVLGLNTWDGSQWSSRVLAETNDHPSIRRGTETNRLGLKAKGGTFVGYVNGQEVLAGEDGTFGEGGLVLGVIGTQRSTTEARFDNFTVSELPAE